MRVFLVPSRMVYYLTFLLCAHIGLSPMMNVPWRGHPQASAYTVHERILETEKEPSRRRRGSTCTDGCPREGNMLRASRYLVRTVPWTPCTRDPMPTVQAHAHGLSRQLSGYPVCTGSTYLVHTGRPVGCCGLCPCNPHFIPPYPFMPWTYIYSSSSSSI
jgi:hypothetical protein